MSLPRPGAVDARRGVQLCLEPRERRDGVSRSAAARYEAGQRRCRRWADGVHPKGLSRLEDLRRRQMARFALAERPEGSRIRVDPGGEVDVEREVAQGWMGCRQVGPHGRRAAQHDGRELLWTQSADGLLVSRRTPRRRGDGAGDGGWRLRRRMPRHLRKGDAADRCGAVQWRLLRAAHHGRTRGTSVPAREMLSRRSACRAADGAPVGTGRSRKTGESAKDVRIDHALELPARFHAALQQHAHVLRGRRGGAFDGQLASRTAEDAVPVLWGGHDGL